MSQSGPNLNCMWKNTGRFKQFFRDLFSTFDETKDRAYTQNLRLCSFHMNVIDGYMTVLRILCL